MILCIGAGQSTSAMIEYLNDYNQNNQFELVVADHERSVAEAKIPEGSSAQAIALDIFDAQAMETWVGKSMMVISMVPARFHEVVLRYCLQFKVHFLSASYVTDEISALSKEIEEAGILVLKECGLDPGIDHMSAMKELDEIKAKGGQLHAFETFTGGLLAPSKLENPWEYKFTWNPRNVVLAGQGVVKFLQEGRYKFIPYQRLFNRTEVIYIPDYGYFEGYANRDSLKYLNVYQLQGIKTLYRGTLRRVGFCKAWNVFVQLGATDDTYQMEGVGQMTHRQFINSFLSYNPDDSVELKLAHYLSISLEAEIMYKLKWLGLFSDDLVGLEAGSPAQILEHILRKKWTLQANEKDMVVMWHRFVYDLDGQRKTHHSYMVVEGKNATQTAISDTVGLPLGIVARMLFEGKINLRGLHRPILPEIYAPVLAELQAHGVTFVRTEV